MRRFPEKSDVIQALFEARMEELTGYAEQVLAADDPWQGLARFPRAHRVAGSR